MFLIFYLYYVALVFDYIIYWFVNPNTIYHITIVPALHDLLATNKILAWCSIGMLEYQAAYV